MYDASALLRYFQSTLLDVIPEAAAIDEDIGGNLITCPPFTCDGTEENDVMIGTAVGDTISGLGGNDVIQGNGFLMSYMVVAAMTLSRVVREQTPYLEKTEMTSFSAIQVLMLYLVVAEP